MFLLTTFLTWTPRWPTLPAQILSACEATSTSRPRIRFLQCSLKGLLNECMVAPLPYEALPATPQVLPWPWPQLAQVQDRRPQYSHLMPSLLITPPLPRAPCVLHNPPPIPLSCQASARHRHGPRHPSPPRLALRIGRLQGA